MEKASILISAIIGISRLTIYAGLDCQREDQTQYTLILKSRKGLGMDHSKKENEPRRHRDEEADQIAFLTQKARNLSESGNIKKATEAVLTALKIKPDDPYLLFDFKRLGTQGVLHSLFGFIHPGFDFRGREIKVPAGLCHGGLALHDFHDQCRFAFGRPAFDVFFHLRAHLCFL